jgi:hypothetical protein
VRVHRGGRPRGPPGQRLTRARSPAGGTATAGVAAQALVPARAAPREVPLPAPVRVARRGAADGEPGRLLDLRRGPDRAARLRHHVQGRHRGRGGRPGDRIRPGARQVHLRLRLPAVHAPALADHGLGGDRAVHTGWRGRRWPSGSAGSATTSPRPAPDRRGHCAGHRDVLALGGHHRGRSPATPAERPAGSPTWRWR